MDDLKKESCYESIGSKTIVEKFQQYEQYEWWNYGTKFREEEEHRHGRENVFLCSMKKTMEGEGKEIVGWHVSRFILVISNGIFANVELEIHYFFVAIQNLINNKTLFKKAKILNIHMQHYHKNYNDFAETHKKDLIRVMLFNFEHQLLDKFSWSMVGKIMILPCRYYY